MTDEEIQTLQTELETTKQEAETAKGEVETLKGQLAERDAAFKPLERELAKAKALLTEKDEALAAATQEVESLRAEGEAVSIALGRAVESYKTLVLESNPGIPGELIKGETIEDVASSLEAARGIVDRVKQSIEAAGKTNTVPTGAPARVGPDLSAMSPREKLQYGLR